MKPILILLIIVLIISFLVGCTLPPESETSSANGPSGELTNEQILEQHPDGLDEALMELDRPG